MLDGHVLVDAHVHVPRLSSLAPAWVDWARRFGRPGVLEETFPMPIGTMPGTAVLHLRLTETLVHGWDLARALGRPAPFPDDLAEQALEFSRAALGNLPPGRMPFAPPKPVPDDAPAIDRLAALLGRDVG